MQYYCTIASTSMMQVSWPYWQMHGLGGTVTGGRGRSRKPPRNYCSWLQNWGPGGSSRVDICDRKLAVNFSLLLEAFLHVGMQPICPCPRLHACSPKPVSIGFIFLLLFKDPWQVVSFYPLFDFFVKRLGISWFVEPWSWHQAHQDSLFDLKYTTILLAWQWLKTLRIYRST